MQKYVQLELAEEDGSIWSRYSSDHNSQVHQRIEEILSKNPAGSLIDLEDKQLAGAQIDRFITKDGLQYIEFDRKYLLVEIEHTESPP